MLDFYPLNGINLLPARQLMGAKEESCHAYWFQRKTALPGGTSDHFLPGNDWKDNQDGDKWWRSVWPTWADDLHITLRRISFRDLLEDGHDHHHELVLARDGDHG